MPSTRSSATPPEHQQPSWPGERATTSTAGAHASARPPDAWTTEADDDAERRPGHPHGTWESAVGRLVNRTPDRRVLVTDALLAFAVLVVYAMTASTFDNPIEPLAGLVMVVSLVVRRTAPLLMLMTVSVSALLFVPSDTPPLAMGVVVPLVAYSVARWVPDHWARLVLAIGAFGALFAAVRWNEYYARGYSAGVIGLVRTSLVAALCFAVVVTPYAIGRRVLESAQLREQRAAREVERQAREEEREAHSVAERDQQARIAEAAMRAQIARELHDIVAHSLSVIIVQAEGGRAMATRRPEAAAQVLGTIAETGREALGEMRRIVSVLRDGPDARAEFGPTPGLDDIDELVTRSGVRAHLDVVGQIPRVPQTLGLTAYRVVQEALTNVLRHAGSDAEAQVLLSCSPHLVVVEVVDNGRGAAAAESSDGRGSGLRGMRERVEAMGGQLLARPRSRGGFLVRALLPVVETPLSTTLPSGVPGRSTVLGNSTDVGMSTAGSSMAPGSASADASGVPDMSSAPGDHGDPHGSGVPQAPGDIARSTHPPQPSDADHHPTVHLPMPEVTQQLPGAPEPTREFPAPDVTRPLWPPSASPEHTTPLPDDPCPPWRS